MTVQQVFKKAEQHFNVDFSKKNRDFFSPATRAKEMAISYAMNELNASYSDIMKVVDMDRTTISLLRSFARGNMQSHSYRATYNDFIQTF